MSGMTSIVKTITRFVGSIILLFGIYLVLHGHLTPGGGFAGGVVIGSSLILITLAYGKEMALQKVSLVSASLFESIGGLIFLGVALLGFTGGYFFLNVLPKGQPFELLSGGIIPLCNIGIGLKVGFALFSMFMVLVIFRSSKEKTE